MGLKNCNRVGCENNMCDMHSDSYGYICPDCYIEGKESGMSIELFMHTPKPKVEKDWDNEFKGN